MRYSTSDKFVLMVDLRAQLSGIIFLLAAARNGLPTAFEILLATGVDSKTRDEFGLTPMSLAAIGGHAHIVRLLLDAGDDSASSLDPLGRIPLHWTAHSGYEDVVKILVDNPSPNADISDTLDGRTALSLAAEGGHTASVQLLLDREDVAAGRKDKFGLTPLAWASRSGREDVVKLLVGPTGRQSRLTRHQWPNAPIMGRKKLTLCSHVNQRTPLSWAVESGHLELARLLPQTVSAGLKDGDKYQGTSCGVGETEPNK
ncbi:uncharacterized protein A1O5_08524 [Cladophialophora psammophila CBS 110553]|uniref:Uncharacterized protein n=1 Tax=Cladophialophora psammophila CBS 110553 TaxID=1182543 RepID=W9WUK3_9EURO|nr:uncharacterized protein A1O5_08524 [Cladophialophora psammophila CBS 110553]EXJ68730.1 hypothetical protein A1O5_08524 [Cladophialophora psammophila CBS 110553]